VLRRLGGGRRYEVFLVWDDHRLAVLVAKVLRPDQADEPAALQDLGREADVLRRLGHPVVVRGFDALVDGPFPTFCSSTSRGRPCTRCSSAMAHSASSSSCRWACTSPRRCTTSPARTSSTST
jgi:serine/threonine protein kinase